MAKLRLTEAVRPVMVRPIFIRKDAPFVHYNRNPIAQVNSFERFDLRTAKRIGSGRDRAAYLLPDGMVIKIAKNPLGLAQNSYQAGNAHLEGGLLPEIVEVGNDYVVEQGADTTSREARKIINDVTNTLNEAYMNEWNPHAYTDSEIAAINDLDEKYPDTSFNDLLNYSLHGSSFLELARKSQWGVIDGRPVLIDGGSLMGSAINDNKEKELWKDDWRQIVDARKAARREGKLVVTR
jgi:hypothetical protein